MEKTMFWLFRRKKVADKKAITPCVYDNGEQVQDAFTLHDFSTRSTSESALSSRLTLGEPGQRGGRKGYRRLNADGGEEPRPQPQPKDDDADLEVDVESSTDSSSECEVDYFGAFTDSEDEDEELTCNVCERSFNSVRRLEQHQQKKRHYGCSICDSIFPGLMALELHKETLDHWSDYELRVKKAQDKESDSEEDDLEEHRVYNERRGDELRRLLL